MSDSETLKDAFNRIGDAAAVSSLPESVQNLTKSDIHSFLKMDSATTSSLKSFAQNRASANQTVIPWDDINDDSGDDMQGGIW